MGTPRRGKIARTMLIWTVMAVIAVTVAGCTQVVKGRAVLAGPKVGQPVEWGPCRISGGGAAKLPGGAQCGKLAVPVDYRHPGGDATTLGLIRVPATHDKIGSLVINPGGPGESGVEAALGVVQSLSPQIRERFDLVGFDPRGVATSRPAIWCNSDADNDRLRTEPQADYSPAGVATSNRKPRNTSLAASRKWARNSWPTSEPTTWPAIWTPFGKLWATAS